MTWLCSVECGWVDASTHSERFDGEPCPGCETDSATLAAQNERARKEQSGTRRQLESRRRWLLGELEICERAIADDDLATARSGREPTNLTVAEVTRHVLTRHPRGVSAVSIVREVQTAKPGADAKAVHAELRHARKTGTRRNFRYFPDPRHAAFNPCPSDAECFR